MYMSACPHISTPYEWPMCGHTCPSHTDGKKKGGREGGREGGGEEERERERRERKGVTRESGREGKRKGEGGTGESRQGKGFQE